MLGSKMIEMMHFPSHLIFAVIFLVITGCTGSQKNENLPDYELIEEFGIDSTELVYQYYQQFGFTDLCEDLRIISKQTSSPGLEKDLPISPEDLAVIAEFSNKGDTFEEKIVIGNWKARSPNQDIENVFLEYIPDSLLEFNSRVGKYEIKISDSGSILKIYDREAKLLYIEVHRCDGF